MFRFLKVRGKPGCIVPNPHGEARRYVGKVAKVFPPDAPRDVSLSLVDMYDDIEEVIRDDAAERAVRNAIKSEHLYLLAEGKGKDAESVTWTKTFDVPYASAVSEKTANKKGG